MEVGDGHAIVMTPDGQFCRIPHSGAGSIGAEVVWTETPVAAPAPRKRRSGPTTWMRWSAAATAACIALAVGVWQGLGGFGGPPTAYAMVSLDIHPSMTMQVDKHLKVLQVTPTDADGQRVVRELPKLQGEPMQQAISQVVKQALSDHLVPADDSIIVAAAPTQSGSSADLPSITNSAQQAVEQALKSTGASQTLQPSVYTVTVPKNVFDAANQADIAPGQLATYLMALNQGVPVTNLNSNTISQVFGASHSASLMKVLGSASTAQISTIVKKLQSVGLLTGLGGQPATPSGGSSSKANAPGGGAAAKGQGSGHRSSNAGNSQAFGGATDPVNRILGEINNTVSGLGPAPPGGGGSRPGGGGSGGGSSGGGSGGNPVPPIVNSVGNLANSVTGGLQNALGGSPGAVLGGNAGHSSSPGRSGVRMNTNKGSERPSSQGAGSGSGKGGAADKSAAAGGSKGAPGQSGTSSQAGPSAGGGLLGALGNLLGFK